MPLSPLRELLVRWAEINSGSSHLAGLDRMRETLAVEFATLPGATVEAVPLTGTTARALRVRQRPSAPRQVLCSGHYDTVYDADHPFQRCTQLDADTLGGPGVADMKGGLVVMLAALRAFEASPAAPALGWEVLLTPDEETGSAASRALIEATAPRFQAGLVFEPGREDGSLVRSRKGTGIFTATCHGRAAHAGQRPQDGRNAILALAEFLLAASHLPDELPGVMLNVGAIRGGGAVNIVPALASADINVRIGRAAQAALVLDRLRQIAAPINARDGYRLELTGQFNRLPLEVGTASTRLFAAWQESARELSLAPCDWVDVGGGSDGNLLSAAGLPCLDGMGPIGGHLHSAAEYVNVPSLADRAHIASRLLEKIATGTLL